MKKLFLSLFVLPAFVLAYGRVHAQEFSWEAFGNEVDRFVDQAALDGFASWRGDLVGTGPMGMFEAFACTEPFMGGSGVLFKNPLGGYEYVLVLQRDELSGNAVPSAGLQENYGYFTEWMASRGLPVVTTNGEGYVGFSKVYESATVDLEESLKRSGAEIGFAIAYETSYSEDEGNQFQYGLVLTITSGYAEGEEAPAVDGAPTEEDDFDWLLYGDEEE